MLNLHERVVECLRSIFDPEIPVNIYDLGLIYHIDVNEEKLEAFIQMTLTTPMCPVAQTFPQTVQDKLLETVGLKKVHVELVWDPPWTQAQLSDAAKLTLNLL